MKKLRYRAMAAAIALGVGVFLVAQQVLPVHRLSAHEFYHTYFSQPARAGAGSYTDAITDDPANYMRYYRRSLHYAERGQFVPALADMNDAVRLSPTPLSLEALGVDAQNTRLIETRTFNRVVLVHYYRAEILEKLNRPDEALADLDRVIALDGRKQDAIYARGYLRAKTGLYDGAIADFDRLLARRTDRQWLLGRGLAHYFKGNWTAAAMDFEKAVRLSSVADSSLLWLAKARLRAGLPLDGPAFAGMTHKSPAWAVVQAFITDHDPVQFIANVKAGAGYAQVPSHGAQCKSALFIGEWLTIRNQGGAHEMFAEAERICAPLSIDRALAAAELRRAAVTYLSN